MNNRKKLLTLFAFSFAILFSFLALASAAILSEWALVDNGNPTNNPSDVSASALTMGPGVSLSDFADNEGARITGWPDSTSPTSDDYFQVTVSPATGKKLTINALDFSHRRSGTGPTIYQVQYSKQANFASPTTLATENIPDESDQDGSITGLTIVVNSGEQLTIRWFGYNASSTAGVWRVLENTLKIQGTVETVSQGNGTLTLEKTQELTRTQNGMIRVRNTGTETLNNIAFTQSGPFTVTFVPSTFNLAPGESRDVTASSTLSNLEFGDNVVTIRANSGTVTSNSVAFTIQNGFCSNGERGGNLSIKNVDISNEGDGDDEEWQILDVIEVEVEVENEGNDDIDDVIVELGLFDSSGDEFTNDLDFENTDEEEIELGDLNDGDEETAKFRFKVPADFEDGDYRLAVKAYSDDLGENVECTHTSSDLGNNNLFESIDVQREDDEGKFIAFDNIVVSPEQVMCGERVTLQTDVTNIGDEDQDQVKINLVSTELNLNEFVEIRNNLDPGDEEMVTFEFAVPANAQTKTYHLILSSDYDYRNGNYRQSSDEDKDLPLRVVCETPTTPPSGGRIATITAALDSDAVAGKQLVVRSTVTNLMSERATFKVFASGYNSWAALESVSEDTLDLEAGESEEVTLTFNVKSDAQGERSFEIETRSGSDSETREVVVNIEPAGRGITGFAGLDLGGNSLIWIIAIVNIILIILIIVVAVRISRR